MTYNLTYIVNQSTNNSLLGMTQAVNSTLGSGWYVSIFLLGLMVILIISFNNRTGDIGQSVAASLFLGFVLSLLMYSINLVPQIMIFITAIGSAAAIAFNKL